MRPERRDIAVPPFPPAIEWIGPEPDPVDRICARGPLALELIDAGHPSSVRTLPYLQAWHERYRELGLTVVAVNSPRFPFTADPAKLEAALRRWDTTFPVASDSRYAIWHDYGAKGWPSLFLWGRGGALRWFQFGEGEYRATEAAIQEELEAADDELPPSLEPIRGVEAPGAKVARPTGEVFPGGSESKPWRAGEGHEALELAYEGGGVWATLDGGGSLEVSLDDGPDRTVEVDAPGAYELAEHEHHEAHRVSLRASAGIAIYAVSFAPGLP